jgi:hypothetical protein
MMMMTTMMMIIITIIIIIIWDNTQVTWYTRPAEPMTSVPKLACGKFSLARGIHSCPIFILFLLPDQRLYIAKNTCICTYI